MLHINDLTFRIEGKPILEGATAGIPTGHKVGLVGRNGAGKTTLLKLITGELAPDDGNITTSRNARIGHVAQEAPGGDVSLIDWVLSTDAERASLLAEAERAADPARIADIQIRLTDIDAHSAPSRAAQILAGLGFDEAAQQRACREFSGGWRMRVALASVLFLEPEILLLDEPTNYLDLEGTLWLEAYLRTYPHTIVIVSHDRDLLNRAVTAILHLERGKLTLYTGGYDDFEETRREKQRLELKLKKKQDDARRHIEAFVERFRAKASKAKQAQSRLKALARMQPIASQVEERSAPLSFPQPAKMLASPLMRLEDAAVGYAAGQPVLSRLDLRIDQDDRIALLGQNGNGKSTFAKLLSGRLPPLAGQVFGINRTRGRLLRAAPARRAQSAEVAVRSFRRADAGRDRGAEADAARLVWLRRGQGRHQGRQSLRRREGAAAAGADGVPPAAPADSGRADQPSRHRCARVADPRAERLQRCRHPHQPRPASDRGQRRAAVDRAATAPWHPTTAISTAIGRSCWRSGPSVERGANGAAGPEQRTGRAEARRDAAQRRAEIAPLRKALQAAEQAVNRLSESIARIDKALADPDLYTRDPQKAQQLSLERGQRAKELEAAEEAWLAAGEAYETASNATGANPE